MQKTLMSRKAIGKPKLSGTITIDARFRLTIGVALAFQVASRERLLDFKALSGQEFLVDPLPIPRGFARFPPDFERVTYSDPK